MLKKNLLFLGLIIIYSCNQEQKTTTQVDKIKETVKPSVQMPIESVKPEITATPKVTPSSIQTSIVTPIPTTNPTSTPSVIVSTIPTIAPSANPTAISTPQTNEKPSILTIKTIIENRCSKCHSASFKTAGFGFSTEKEIVDTKSSIKSAVKDKRMPQGNVTSMTEEERKLIDQW